MTKGSCTYDLKPIKKTKLKLLEYQNFKDEWVGFYTISPIAYDHHLAILCLTGFHVDAINPINRVWSLIND